MSSEGDEPAEILLVDNEVADVELVREVLSSSKRVSRIHDVPHGRAALAFLRGEPPFENAPWPALVLLDLNMPVMDGRETLAAIRSDPMLKVLPVVIMTSSDRDQDVRACYELGASCYVRKPLDFAELENVVGAIEKFWLETATLPPRPR